MGDTPSRFVRAPILRSTRGSAVARAAREAASACGVPLHVVRLVPGAGVDGVPLGSKGLRGVTLLSASTGRAVRAVHRPADRPENLDPDALERAGRVALALAERLAAPASSA